jgi:hypothetical protein
VDDGPTTGAGIQGTTVVDGCPVKRDPPCPDKPISARVAVLDAGGSVLAAVESADDGTFTVTIGPGEYVLRPDSPAGGLARPPEPFVVSVKAHVYTAVIVRFDSGVR